MKTTTDDIVSCRTVQYLSTLIYKTEMKISVDCVVLN